MSKKTAATVGNVLELLNLMLKSGKITKDTPLVYSTDDEGNSFQYVFFMPTLGSFDENSREFETDDIDKKNVVVCIN